MLSPSTPYAPLARPAAHGALQSIHRQPFYVRWILLLLICGGIGWVDYITGWEVSMFVFYAVPILLAVWWFGRNAALFIAAVSGFVWWKANLDGNPYETWLGYVGAMLNRLIYFIVVALGAIAVRNRQASDAAYIRMLEHQRELENEIIAVSEREQQRIGQDLHDGLCQQMAAIGCAARALADDLKTQQLPESQDAEHIEQAIKQSVIEARNLARGIFPAHVENGVLVEALAEMAETTAQLTGMSIRFEFDADLPTPDNSLARHLYRITQQAFANAVQHSGGKSILITLRRSNPTDLELTIADDGQGMPFALPHKSPGMGLRIMRYRAGAIGATLQVRNRPTGGTLVSCKLKLPTPPA